MCESDSIAEENISAIDGILRDYRAKADGKSLAAQMEEPSTKSKQSTPCLYVKLADSKDGGQKGVFKPLPKHTAVEIGLEWSF